MSKNNIEIRSRTSNDCIAKRSQKIIMARSHRNQEQVKQARNEAEDQSNNPGRVAILENSPVGESQSNVSVECAIKEVQHHIQTQNAT